MGSFHAFELLYVFDTLDEQPGYIATDGEEALCQAVGGYWSRFAATGDPNGDGAVVWPQYDPAVDSFLALDEEITNDVDLRTSECDYWDTEWAAAPAP
jgi:para-nitrobenzyl esterase